MCTCADRVKAHISQSAMRYGFQTEDVACVEVESDSAAARKVQGTHEVRQEM